MEGWKVAVRRGKIELGLASRGKTGSDDDDTIDMLGLLVCQGI